MNRGVRSKLKTAGNNWEETLNSLSAKYSRLFEAAAPAMFFPMLEGTEKELDRLFTVTPSEATKEILKKSAELNTEAIKNIPIDHVERIRDSLIEHPGDLEKLTSILEEVDGKSERQARNVALGLTRKTYQDLALEKAQQTGATEGDWIHSHGSKVPRPRHLAFHGKRFKLADGAPVGDDGGNYVQPGEEYGCKCTFRIVIDFGVK